MYTYIVGILSKDLLERGKIYRNKYADEKIIFALDLLEEFDRFTWKGKIKVLMLRIASFLMTLTPEFCLFDKISLNEDDKLVIASRELFYETIRKHVCKAITKKDIYLPVKDYSKGVDWYKGNLSLPELDYIEYHVSWHCNLKCKGCGHYSNLCDEPMFGDWEQYKNDLHRIHELVDNVMKIRLMGGEPLLNPELSKFIYSTRKEFEGADIRVVSNGLLIPTCSEELLIAMRETGATFDITQYPPTSRVVDKICKRCCDYGVQVNISEPVTQFFAASDGSVEYNIMDSWNACESRSCHFLYNGEMSVCGAPIIAKILGDKTESKAKYSDNDMVNIYDADLTSEEFIKKMSSPITMCKYCDKVEKIFFDWQGGYKKYFSSQLLRKDIRDFQGDE